MIEKSTLVAGASTNPERYSYLAIERLQSKDVAPVIAVGLKVGKVGNVEIQTQYPDYAVDTITLYLGPKNQGEVREYIEKYPPKRVIFNPGTEDMALYQSLKAKGVEVLNACTLVMLGTDQF
mgnify:CR=1 FL=1